jgi:hypothetical protein
MTYLDNLIVELEKELTDRYGLMLPSRVLWKVLGYSSPDAWRQSIRRGTIPIAIFQLPGRSGYFGLSRDVATLMAKARLKAEQPKQGNISYE